MVNSCGNAMWLIRQAIPSGVQGKEQGQDQKTKKRDS